MHLFIACDQIHKKRLEERERVQKMDSLFSFDQELSLLTAPTLTAVTDHPLSPSYSHIAAATTTMTSLLNGSSNDGGDGDDDDDEMDLSSSLNPALTSATSQRLHPSGGIFQQQQQQQQLPQHYGHKQSRFLDQRMQFAAAAAAASSSSHSHVTGSAPPARYLNTHELHESSVSATTVSQRQTAVFPATMVVAMKTEELVEYLCGRVLMGDDHNDHNDHNYLNHDGEEGEKGTTGDVNDSDVNDSDESGSSEVREIFRREKIDGKSFLRMNQQSLRMIGLRMGPLQKLLQVIESGLDSMSLFFGIQPKDDYHN